MNFTLDQKTKELRDAAEALGKRCRDLTPARAGEDWRQAGARDLLRAGSLHQAAVFLDAYAAARGSVRAARVHAGDVLARAPQSLEAALLAGAVQGLVAEVLENLRLPEDTRPAGFPDERDPDARRALADARAWSLLAREQAIRAAWVEDAGTPSGDVRQSPAIALAAACDAVVKTWPALSRLLIGEESYTRYETDVFRPAAKARHAAIASIATVLLGEVPRKEGTVTAEKVR